MNGISEVRRKLYFFLLNSMLRGQQANEIDTDNIRWIGDSKFKFTFLTLTSSHVIIDFSVQETSETFWGPR